MDEKYLKPKVLFVDDEVNVIEALKRTLYPYKKEWDIYFAQSGFDALELLDKTTVNIIVSDMRMPQMNGAELLLKVQEKHPEIIRIILSGHSDEDLIMKSVKVAHQFLNKPCSTEALINTIKDTFYLRGYLRNEPLLKVVNGIAALPALPEIYIKIENELSSKNVSLCKVASLVSEDLNLSAKILQVVNSAFFGLPTKIADLDSAVSFLGVDTIKGLLLLLKFQNYGNQLASEHFSLEKIFAHSLKVAKSSELIFRSENGNPLFSKEAYAAGLLHDIGKLILLQYEGFKKAFSNNNIPLSAEKEYEILGVSHAEVGAYLLGVWNLPHQIVEAVAFHHSPAHINTFGINAAVYFANLLVNTNNISDLEIFHSPFEDKIERWYTLIKNI